MLADGGAAFTKATGLEFETANFGGLRMQRLSMLVCHLAPSSSLEIFQYLTTNEEKGLGETCLY